MTGRSILLVEDEPLIAEIMTEELEAAGYQVVCAGTGELALAAFQEKAIHLLFTDIRLPGRVDGWALAEEVRRQSSDLPIIFATGFTGEIARKVSNSRFVLKPYRPTDVLRIIAELERGDG